MTAGQALLENKLVSGLSGKIPGFDASSVTGQGATSLRNLVPSDQLPLVLEVYNAALRDVWYLALALAIMTFFASLGLEWKSVKKDKKAEAMGQSDSATELTTVT